jgi:type VI secretion system protein ImpC
VNQLPQPRPEEPEAARQRALLDRILADARPGVSDGESQDVHSAVEHLVDELLACGPHTIDELEAVLGARIADIDALLSAQVNEILHAEPFQRLEASWRGLHYLVSQAETGSMLKIRVLDASKDDLRKDLETASEFDQSALFVKIYEDEYGMFGGEPFGALIGDYEFGRHPQDVALLERFSNVAAAAHAPLLSGASPALFGWESFIEISVPRDLSRIFASAEYVKWRAYRDSEDSRYVGLTLPRILLREPYRPETSPVETFVFHEDVSGPDHRKYLWGNAAYALGTRLADAFARYNWCAMIRGTDGGGLVEGLPSADFGTDDEGLVVRGPTEVAITEHREKELADLGFVPLTHCKGTGYPVFFSTQSCQRSKRYDTDEANANARLATQLQYILSTSRFAHYVKAMMRDKVGHMMTPRDCEDYLNRWITGYCLANPESADTEGKARKPLRDAQISVREVRGKPGCYEAVTHLQPHFQLDELTVALRLVTELPPPAQGR